MRYLAVVLMNVSLLPTGLFAQQTSPVGRGIPDGWPPYVQQLIPDVISAKYPTHAAEAYGKLFKQIGTEGIRKLQSHPNDSIAIQAAWEEVELTIPEKPVEDNRHPYAPDRNTLDRFLGFLQERGRLQAPQWWKDLLVDACATRRYSIRFGLPENRPFVGPTRRKPSYHKSGFGVTCPPDTQLSGRGDSMVLRVGKESVKFPDDLLHDHRGHRGGKWDSVSALITPSRCYVALHDNVWEYRLVCLDRPSSKVLWKTDVWGDWWGSYIGPAFEQSVTVTEQNSRVVVFGCGLGIHCEAFRSEDGANIFRLSNTYSEWLRDRRASGE